MMASSGSRDRCQEISAGWDLGSDDSIVGTPTGKNRLSGLRCAGIVQSVCHGLTRREGVEAPGNCCTARAQILII
jgi:hypothetical protein